MALARNQFEKGFVERDCRQSHRHMLRKGAGVDDIDQFKDVFRIWVEQVFFLITNCNLRNKLTGNSNNVNAEHLTEVKRYNSPDGSFILVYLGDEQGPHQLELTWLRDRQEPYNLGDNEFHLALMVDDFSGAHALHEKMGCICYENNAMGIYFINDPDDYWVEIIPKR